jgi:hypothetical protein
LTIFQNARKKGGEGGEAGVSGDEFFPAGTPPSTPSPPFSWPVWKNVAIYASHDRCCVADFWSGR